MARNVKYKIYNGTSWEELIFPVGSHNHTLTLASTSEANNITLAHGTKYKLSAGGSSIVFTMPSSGDTNYYPTRSYTTGLKISGYSGSQNCELYVPYATASQDGVISTGDQEISGLKTFDAVQFFDNGGMGIVLTANPESEYYGFGDINILIPPRDGMLAMDEDIPDIAPKLLGSVSSSSNKFTFNINTTYNLSSGGGLGVFTFGNCMMLIPLFNLTSGTTYKTAGTFVYDTSGSVITTTINYKYTRSGSVNRLEIWSGNSNYPFVNGYTGYLFLTKLK